MKRTLLTLSIIASISSLAATTGSVEFKLKNTNTYDMYEKDKKKFRKVENKLDEVKLLTNVKVKNVGLSFGVELKGKDIELPLNDKSNIKGNILDNSSIFAKYEFSKSYVGATVKKENISLNGGINTKIDNTTYGADFVQVIPYKLDRNKAYLTSKLYLTNDNINASIEVKNNYGEYKYGKYNTKNQPVENGALFSPIEHVYLNVDVNKKIKNTKIYANADVRYLFNENLVEYTNYLTGEDDVFRSWTSNTAPNHKIYQAYKLGVMHNIKDVELNAELFGQNAMKQEINGKGKKNLNNLPRVVAYFGTKLGVKYKATDNLVLSAKTTVGGTYNRKVEYKDKGSNGKIDTTKGVDNYEILAGYFDIALGAKYDYKSTDKFTITPEFNAKASFDNLNFDKAKNPRYYQYATNTKTLIQLNLEPKVSMKYDPIKDLSIVANVALPINFSNKAYINEKNKYDQPSGKKYQTDVKNFRFNSVIPKVEMNIKYMW